MKHLPNYSVIPKELHQEIEMVQETLNSLNHTAGVLDMEGNIWAVNTAFMKEFGFWPTNSQGESLDSTEIVDEIFEEVYYKNRQSRGGGSITDDVTEGFGPEMYTLKKAKPGKYSIKANYYGMDNNRTTARTKVYVTVYEGFGTKHQQITKRTVTLNNGKEKRNLLDVKIEK